MVIQEMQVAREESITYDIFISLRDDDDALIDLSESVLQKLVFIRTSLNDKYLQLQLRKKNVSEKNEHHHSNASSSNWIKRNHSLPPNNPIWKKGNKTSTPKTNIFQKSNTDKGAFDKQVLKRLNSLTEQNIEQIVNDIMRMIESNWTNENVSFVIHTIIQSATTQVNYILTYALLCQRLVHKWESVNTILFEKIQWYWTAVLEEDKLDKIEYVNMSRFFSMLYMIQFISSDVYISFLEMNLNYYEKNLSNRKSHILEYSMDAIMLGILTLFEKSPTLARKEECKKELQPFIVKLRTIWENESTPIRIKFQLYNIRDEFMAYLK